MGQAETGPQAHLSVLLERQRVICGHFGPSSSPVAKGIGSSVGAKLARKCPRCSLKLCWSFSVKSICQEVGSADSVCVEDVLRMC